MQRVSEGRPYLQTASSVHYFPEGTQHSFVVNRKQIGGGSQIDPQSQGIQMQVLAPGAPEQQSLSTWETR